VAARKNNHKQQRSLPWGPMFISFAVGLFIMFLVNLEENAPVEAGKKKAKSEQQAKTIEPTFDFYTLLPEMEVVVDTPKQNQQKAIVTSPPQTASIENPADKASFILQVGSFKNAEDADGFRARLALLGIESKVQKVTIDNKDTWHRVQLGPVVGRDEADKLQKQLKQNNIDSLLMRARHS
jgi:cell division protein FtsN